MNNSISEVWNDISDNFPFLQRREIANIVIDKAEMLDDYKNKVETEANVSDAENKPDIIKETIRAAGVGFSASNEYAKEFLDEHNLTDTVNNIKNTATDMYKGSRLYPVFNSVVEHAKEGISFTLDRAISKPARETLVNAGRSAVDAFKSGYNDYAASKSSDDIDISR